MVLQSDAAAERGELHDGVYRYRQHGCFSRHCHFPTVYFRDAGHVTEAPMKNVFFLLACLCTMCAGESRSCKQLFKRDFERDEISISRNLWLKIIICQFSKMGG